jgi:hypothetical protein
MQKLVGILVVAATCIAAAMPGAAAVPGAHPLSAAVATAVKSRVLLVRGGMNPGGMGGMNLGGMGGTNAGRMGITGNPGAGDVRNSEGSTCAPSFWSKIFGASDADRCAALRTSVRKDQRPTKHVARNALQPPAKTADAIPPVR